MRNTLLSTILFLFLLGSFTSCEEACKQCTGDSVTESYVDGNLESTVTLEVPATEYCGEALEMIDTGSPIESEKTVGNIRSVTKITYSCN